MSEQNYDWEKALLEQEKREQFAKDHSLHEVLGNIDEFKRRLEAGADPNERDEEGTSPLYRVITSYARIDSDREKIEYVELLLAAGADINAQGAYGHTPLHRTGDSAVLTMYLLSKGADPTIKSNSGYTALDYAKMLGRPEVVDVLQNAMGECQTPGQAGEPELIIESEETTKPGLQKSRFSNRTISRGKYFWIVGSCFMSLIIFHFVLSNLR